MGVAAAVAEPVEANEEMVANEEYRAEALVLTPEQMKSLGVGILAGQADHAPNAIGWTPEITARLKWLLNHGKDFEAMVLEIDREVGHFTAGLEALANGDYERAALGLWNAGMIEKSPSAVEETEE